MLAMDQAQGPTLRIFRLPSSFLATEGLLSGAVQPILSRPHPILNGHVGVADAHGRYYMLRLSECGAHANVTAVYELQLCIDAGPAQTLSKPWRAFEHLADDGLLCCQRGSGRILFAQLPLCEGEHGGVFLFGTHEGDVLCLVASRGLLVSGDSRGCVRLWSLDSGAQLDSRRHPGSGVQITEAAFVGPLMVAVGTDQGDVTVYDISTSRMEAVQRFRAGDGPVSSLAARLTPAQVAAAATADAPRRLDGGGVLAGPVGLPWRSGTGQGATEQGTETLLAVASMSGWLAVFAATGYGEATWRRVHVSGSVEGGCCPFLSYSPDGDYLAVGAGDSLVLYEAASMQSIIQRHFPPGVALVAAGFLPPAAGGSTLVALPRAGTLAAALRLRLYAVPEAGQPLLIEVTRPLHDPPAAPAWERKASTQHLQHPPPDPEGLQPATSPGDPEDHLDWLYRAAVVGSATEAGGALPPAQAPLSPAAAGAPGWLKGDWQTTGNGTSPKAASGLREAWPGSPQSTRPTAAAPAWGWQAFAPHADASPMDSRSANLLDVAMSSPRATQAHVAAAAAAAPPPPSAAERGSVGEPWTSPGGRTMDAAAVGAASSPPSARLHPGSCTSTASPLLLPLSNHGSMRIHSNLGHSGATGGGHRARTPPTGVGTGSRSSPGAFSPSSRHAGCHASTGDVLAGSTGGAEGPGVSEAAPVHVWQAYRPATQPAPRSWITGLPPRADFLPQPHQRQPSPHQRPPLGHYTPPTSTTTAPLSSSMQSTAAAAAGHPEGENAAAVHSRPRRPGGEAMGTVQEEEEGGVLGAVGGVMATEVEGGELDADGEPEMPHSGALLPASPDGLLYGGTADWRTGDLDMDPAGFRCRGQREEGRIHHPIQEPVNSPSNTFASADDDTLGDNPDLCRTAYGDPLQRTAFFGDQLSSLWGDGGFLTGAGEECEELAPSQLAATTPTATFSGTGQEAVVRSAVSRSGGGGGGAGAWRGHDQSQLLLRNHQFDERRDMNAERTASEWERSREAHGLVATGGLAAAREQRRGEEGVADDVEDEDEELVPRGAGGLPQPQPQPPLSGERHWGTATQLVSEEGDMSSCKTEAEAVVVVCDAGTPGWQRRQQQTPEAEEGGEEGEGSGGGEVDDGQWADWANADVLRGNGQRHGEAAATAKTLKARPVRHPSSSTPSLRQPPATLTAHRMQLSAVAAASNAIQPHPQPHTLPHPSDELEREKLTRSRPRSSSLPGAQRHPTEDVPRPAIARPQPSVSEATTTTTSGRVGPAVSCNTSSSPPPYRTGLSTAQRPALMSFRGYKPTHQQVMQAIRKNPAAVGCVRAAAAGRTVVNAVMVEHVVRPGVWGRVGATGQEEEEEKEAGFETPRSRESLEGSPGFAESRLQSPAVLLGSPSGSITTQRSRGTARDTTTATAATGPPTRRSGRQQSAPEQLPPPPDPGAESHARESVDSAASSMGGGPGTGGKHLAHLRRLRQSQQQLRHCGTGAGGHGGGGGGGGGGGSQLPTALPARLDEHAVSVTTAAGGVLGDTQGQLQHPRQRQLQPFPAAGVAFTRPHRYSAPSNRRGSAPGHLQPPPQQQEEEEVGEEEGEELGHEHDKPQYPAAAVAVNRIHRHAGDGEAAEDTDPYIADTPHGPTSAAYGRNSLGLGTNMRGNVVKHPVAAAAAAPTSDPRSLSPVSVPQFGSTALLLRRMAVLEQTLNQPGYPPSSTARAIKHPQASAKSTVTGVSRGVDASHQRPVRAGAERRPAGSSGGEPPLALAAASGVRRVVSVAAREEAARRAATQVTHVPCDVKLYRDLPSVDEEPPQPARLAKQLHPGWVASRQQKPDLASLWNPENHAKEICNTRGVALYVPPSPSEVAVAALQLCWI